MLIVQLLDLRSELDIMLFDLNIATSYHTFKSLSIKIRPVRYAAFKVTNVNKVKKVIRPRLRLLDIVDLKLAVGRGPFRLDRRYVGPENLSRGELVSDIAAFVKHIFTFSRQVSRNLYSPNPGPSTKDKNPL